MSARVIRAMTVAGLSLASAAFAQPVVSFTRIADTATAIPEAPGRTFARFGIPYLDDTDASVGFRGFGDGDFEGLYTSDAVPSLVKVVDTTDRVPGFNDRFISLVPGHLDAGTTVFVGTRKQVLDFPRQQVYIQRGVYTGGPGGLTQVVRTFNTLAPGVDRLFTDVASPTIEDGDIAFIGRVSSLRSGLYSVVDGTLRAVIDSTDLVPGSPAPFNAFGAPFLRDGSIAFWGGNETLQSSGIYLVPAVGGIMDATVAVDTRTDQPENGVRFVGFNEPALRDGMVTFEAFNRPDPRGLYLSNAGVITELTDSRTNVPGTELRFFHYGQASTAVGRTVFYGLGREGGAGVFLLSGGAIERILFTGDLLDGVPVVDARISVHGFDGIRVAMHVAFADETEAIYLARLSDPATSACACDLTGDGAADVSDLLVFLESWFVRAAEADATGDGAVSVADLLLFLECWLSEPCA